MKCLSVAILFMLCSITVMAQCPNSIRQVDIAASYGSISGDQVSIGVRTDNRTITSVSGATFLSVRYFLYAYLSLGFTGGVMSEKGQYADSYNRSVIKSTFTQQATTIAPEIYYVYLYRKYFEAYTLLGAGASFITTTTTTNATPYAPASTVTEAKDGLKMQYTPIGIRVGGHLSGFVELGFGYKGIVNTGISFRFGQRSWWRQ